MRVVRTLVVDDDFRVARIHSASVDRVEGFTCVGEAHTAGAARELIATLQPDLLLLDIYLPDEDGLSLLKELLLAPTSPDCIIISAARDLQTVRAALRLGVVYYLVKPFGFAQLRDQLTAYARWRTEADTVGDADQQTVDTLFSLLRAPATANQARSRLAPTMRGILDAVHQAAAPISAADVAEQLGVSRATAQRHLTRLEQQGLVVLSLDYGTGRPIHLFRWAGGVRS